MASVEGKPAKTSKADVTFTGRSVKIAPAAIDHILRAGGIEEVHRAMVEAKIKDALLTFKDLFKAREELRPPTRSQEDEAGKALEVAAKGLLKVMSQPVVNRRLLAYQNRDRVRSDTEGARSPAPDVAKQALDEKIAVVEQLRVWAAEMIEKPGFPDHARPSRATNSKRPELLHLSVSITRIWRALNRCAADEKSPPISATSPFVRFAKEVYGLAGEDRISFETLKDRLEAACAELAEYERLSRG